MGMDGVGGALLGVLASSRRKFGTGKTSGQGHQFYRVFTARLKSCPLLETPVIDRRSISPLPNSPLFELVRGILDRLKFLTDANTARRVSRAVTNRSWKHALSELFSLSAETVSLSGTCSIVGVSNDSVRAKWANREE